MEQLMNTDGSTGLDSFRDNHTCNFGRIGGWSSPMMWLNPMKNWALKAAN